MLQRADDSADNEDISGMFQADANGHLILNEKTHLNIEKLVLLNTPKELKVKREELSTILPPAAHRQLVRLTNNFINYMTAVMKKYPPGKELKTVSEAMKQHDGVHALRVKYFGPEASTAFFGEEEKLSRRLLEIMSTLDESIPLPDRAHMAQEILKKSMDANLKPVR